MGIFSGLFRSRDKPKDSYDSPSLMAEIIYQKYFLFLPLYRIESEFRNKVFNLSRQTMCNWITESVNTYLWMVYDYIITLLMNEQYHQCDETTWRVIMDGRPVGSKSFIWLHTTSELCECNPIIIFAYEMTRGTDHLRKLYVFLKTDTYLLTTGSPNAALNLWPC